WSGIALIIGEFNPLALENGIKRIVRPRCVLLRHIAGRWLFWSLFGPLNVRHGIRPCLHSRSAIIRQVPHSRGDLWIIPPFQRIKRAITCKYPAMDSQRTLFASVPYSWRLDSRVYRSDRILASPLPMTCAGADRLGSSPFRTPTMRTPGGVSGLHARSPMRLDRLRNGA